VKEVTHVANVGLILFNFGIEIPQKFFHEMMSLIGQFFPGFGVHSIAKQK
jgi:hypothetical protein